MAKAQRNETAVGERIEEGRCKFLPLGKKWQGDNAGRGGRVDAWGEKQLERLLHGRVHAG
jgi:hypothetical protein